MQVRIRDLLLPSHCLKLTDLKSFFQHFNFLFTILQNVVCTCLASTPSVTYFDSSQFICDFLQPDPFVQRILSTLLESNDGFADSLLLCSPQPKLLLEKDVEEWCTEMCARPLESLCKPYQLISDAHQNLEEKLYYEYSPAAKEICYA